MRSVPHRELPLLMPMRAERVCEECARPIPRGCNQCPWCQWCRPKFEGEGYPGKEVARFDWVLGQQIGDPTAKLVLLALASFDKPRGKGIFLRVEVLARMASCSPATVHRALRRLQRDGWLKVDQRWLQGRQASSIYTIRQAETVLIDSQSESRSDSQIALLKDEPRKGKDLHRGKDQGLHGVG